MRDQGPCLFPQMGEMQAPGGEKAEILDALGSLGSLDEAQRWQERQVEIALFGQGRWQPGPLEERLRRSADIVEDAGKGQQELAARQRDISHRTSPQPG